MSYAVDVDDEALRALWRYCHDANTFDRRAARAYALRVLEDVGSMGLDEQIHEGRERVTEDDWAAADYAKYGKGHDAP